MPNLFKGAYNLRHLEHLKLLENQFYICYELIAGADVTFLGFILINLIKDCHFIDYVLVSRALSLHV